MRYLLAVNRTIRGKLAKDATAAQWAAFNDAFENVELTAAQIAAAIQAGHAIAAQHAGRRKVSNWRLAQHVGIDLDDGRIEWDELVGLPLVADHAAIIHTTASHTEKHPRYRVLFLLEEPLTNPAGYRHVVECMLRAFDTADPLCKDASRLFFGAPNCSLLLQPANVLTNEDVANIVTAWPEPAAAPPDAPPPVYPQPPRPSTPPHDPGGDIIPPARLSPRRRDAHSAALLHRIATAPDGQKWETLRNTAILFGGYVASGYYSEEEARKWLQDAIQARRPTVASMPAAYDTIDRGLTYGQLSPLYYTRADDGRTPPPPPAGRTPLRHRLIADRLAELETLIKDAPANAPDFGEWVLEYADLQRARDLLAPPTMA